MRITGLTKGRISQLLDDNEPFGEAAARRLEQSLRLPDRFFDAEGQAGYSPLALAFAAWFDKASPEEQRILSRLIPEVDFDEPELPDLGGVDTNYGDLDPLEKKKGQS